MGVAGDREARSLQRSAPWRALRRNIEEADRLLYAEIAERRADPDLAERTDAAGDAGPRRPTTTARAMTDRELRDQLMTLLVAGHDTTATGLSWALERLTRHPAILDKAVRAAEASAAGDSAGDEYPRRGRQGDAADPAGGLRCRPDR